MDFHNLIITQADLAVAACAPPLPASGSLTQKRKKASRKPFNSEAAGIPWLPKDLCKWLANTNGGSRHDTSLNSKSNSNNHEAEEKKPKKQKFSIIIMSIAMVMVSLVISIVMSIMSAPGGSGAGTMLQTAP